MTCHSRALSIMRYIDNELDRCESYNLLLHLAVCRHCRRERDQLLSVSMLVKRSWPTHRISARVRELIRSLIELGCKYPDG